MKLLILPLLFALTSARYTPASSEEPGDDTLKYFLSKSDLVASGTITNLMLFTTDTTTYLFDFQVRDVMKGDGVRKNQSIAVSIKRLEDRKWKGHPLLKEGSLCILFLRNAKPPDVPSWREADQWFAVQPSSDSMILALRRLESERSHAYDAAGKDNIPPELVGEWADEHTTFQNGQVASGCALYINTNGAAASVSGPAIIGFKFYATYDATNYVLTLRRNPEPSIGITQSVCFSYIYNPKARTLSSTNSVLLLRRHQDHVSYAQIEASK